jgi:site-specific recombinase XerC
MKGVCRLCASLMYGSDLRLSECTSLRVKDIDFDRGEIMVLTISDGASAVYFPALLRPYRSFARCYTASP